MRCTPGSPWETVDFSFHFYCFTLPFFSVFLFLVGFQPNPLRLQVGKYFHIPLLDQPFPTLMGNKSTILESHCGGHRGGKLPHKISTELSHSNSELEYSFRHSHIKHGTDLFCMRSRSLGRFKSSKSHLTCSVQSCFFPSSHWQLKNLESISFLGNLRRY